MADSQDLAAKIEEDLAAAEQFGRQFLVDEITGGTWLDTTLRSGLESHRKEFDAEFFQVACMAQSRLEVAASRLETAKRLSALEGTLTSDAYTPAVSNTLGKGGGESAVVPDGAMRFVADLVYMTQLQARFAHDLCLIFGREIDLDDPVDMFEFACIAHGARAGERLHREVMIKIPEARERGIDPTLDGIGDAVRDGLPALGRHVLRRNLVKYVIPVVSVPLNAALNYYFTADVVHMAGKMLGQRMEDPEMREELGRIATAKPRILLESIWCIIVADESISQAESKFINNLTLKLTEIEGGEETIGVIRQLEGVDRDDVLKRLADESEEVKKAIYEVLADVAAIDHKIHRKEKKVVQRFAEACGMTYDIKDLKRRAKMK